MVQSKGKNSPRLRYAGHPSLLCREGVGGVTPLLYKVEKGPGDELSFESAVEVRGTGFKLRTTGIYHFVHADNA